MSEHNFFPKGIIPPEESCLAITLHVILPAVIAFCWSAVSLIFDIWTLDLDQSVVKGFSFFARSGGVMLITGAYIAYYDMQMSEISTLDENTGLVSKDDRRWCKRLGFFIVILGTAINAYGDVVFNVILDILRR